MHFTEIGQQLRAYRLESGMRAEEIAARLGVSRAALYRYEKGEVIKLDTINRLAELLKISPLSLLGIGVEYYNRPIGYFERIRQIEEAADQILLVNEPFCYLTSSDNFDATLSAALTGAGGAQPAAPADPAAALIDQVLAIQAARKRAYAQRRPSIIAMLPAAAVEAFLARGIAAGVAISDRARRQCREVAASEIETIAQLMESEPMGLQFGLIEASQPTAAFTIVRMHDRASVAINPFPAESNPATQIGVAMITSADEAVTAYQRVAEAAWREAVKGPAGGARLRQLLAQARA
jgi:transcriptional regulator with XRE-family HTH domain